MATAAKFVLPIAIFLAYLVPLDVDVTGNITAKICEVWRQPLKSCNTLRWIFLQSFMKFDERNPFFF
jgi:hypothetical protein